ncbi:MAG: PKD domain-containing protein [Bacteroidota bacterium]
MKQILLTILLLLLLPALWASHHMGGSISVEHLGACIYRLHGTAFIDCNGNAALTPVTPTGMPIGTTPFVFTPLACANLPTQPTLVTPHTSVLYQEVTPICPTPVLPGQLPMTYCQGTSSIATFNGVAEYTFYMDYDFCGTSCDSFDIWLTGCCRNINTTLASVGSNGTFIVGTSVSVDTTVANNSPIFNQMPQVYICLGNTTYADISATDPDGDSLAYRMTDCYSELSIFNFGPATYLATYSAQDPMGPFWQIDIDSHSGLLTVNPNPNGSMESALICIAVDEFREGVQIGTVNREFQVTVVDCNSFPNQIPLLDTLFPLGGPGIMPGGLADTFLVAPGDTLRVAVAFSDQDMGDTISVYPITADMTGFNWTNVFANPSYGVFEWMADSSLLGQVVPLAFLAKDSHCPKPSFGATQCYVRMVEYALSATITPAACGDSVGEIDLYVSGGVAPYSYQWSNGEFTEDIDSLLPGNYTVTVTDANNSVLNATYFVAGVDLVLNDSIFQPGCNANDGWIKITPQSTNGPFSYVWSNGQTTDSASNLAPGIHAVFVTDAFGCVNQWIGTLDPADSCYVEVSGIAFHDVNANCIQDPGEAPLPFVVVDVNPGGAVMTDSLGAYSFQLDTGSYDILVASDGLNNVICPPSAMHSLIFDDYDADTSMIDFGIQIGPTQDLSLYYLIPTMAKAGQHRLHHLLVYNDGNDTVSGSLELQIDPQEQLLNFSPPSPGLIDTVNGLFRWQLPMIVPGGHATRIMTTQLPTSLQINDSLFSSATVSPIVGDSTPDNNFYNRKQFVVGPFDPNDKLVSPKGVGPAGYISTDDSVLTYTVRFQNVGNAPAQLVVIRDTVDSDLDALGYQALGYSFPYQLQIEDDSILIFSFPGINLPDSTSDPVGSQGFVQFSLPHRGTLPPFTEIRNHAAIYFDFNAPIITNTVLNTLYPFPELRIQEDTFCRGELLFAELSVPGVAPYDFVWSTGDQGMGLPVGAFGTLVDSSGWYSLTVVDSNGFSATDSVFALVSTQAPIANFSVTQSGLDLTFANLSQEGLSYQWDFGDGSSSTDSLTIHTFPASGVYSVQLMVQNACGADTSTQSLSVIATGLAEEFERSVKLLPNPFDSQAILQFFNPNQQKYDLHIYDLQGKLVRSYPDNRNAQFVIERGNLSPGLYFYRLEGEFAFAGKFLLK